MATDQAVRLDVPILQASPAKIERRFFTGMAIAAAAVIFAGFGRTYYLKSFTGAPELSPLVHLHAAVFTAWVVLFLVQVRLIAGRQLALHRRLGFATVALSAAMIVLGVLALLSLGRRGISVAGVEAKAFMLIPLVDLLVFGSAVTLAVIYRRRAAAHKRLMLLALTGGLLLPAISRLPVISAQPPLILVVLAAFLGAGALYDRLSMGRVHPVNAWGALAVFLTVPLRFILGRTAAWDAVASWMIR